MDLKRFYRHRRRHPATKDPAVQVGAAFLDTLRVLSRGADPKPMVDFMQRMQRWTARFQYDRLEAAISALEFCNAMQESPARFKLLEPA